jgi:hypothetical protein
MRSIIAALLFGALAIVATPTTASAKVKPGKTYNWLYKLARVAKEDSSVSTESGGSFVLKSKCEAVAKKLSKEKPTTLGFPVVYVCLRKQP